jgi:type II secretory pathway pseudopilin PulG
MRRKEKGFGLISLAVAIAIGSLIAAGAGMTCIQIIRGAERNNNHAEVIQQAHNLGRWFSRDAPMAENITFGDDPETGDDELLTIYWKDWESGDTYDIRYIWLDDVDSLKRLKRNQVMRDKDGDLAENITSLIACSIYSANLSQQDDTWILNVETHSGNKSSLQEYRTTQRLND